LFIAHVVNSQRVRVDKAGGMTDKGKGQVSKKVSEIATGWTEVGVEAGKAIKRDALFLQFYFSFVYFNVVQAQVRAARGWNIAAKLSRK
jgi:hypothetical protein